MELDLFLWFLCGCYLLGGMSIGYWFNEWRHKRKSNRTGTGRWDYRKRPDTEDGGYFK